MSLSSEERAKLVHDVRSPLAAISGYAELLSTRDDDEVRREAPAAIAASAEQLSAAVDVLLDRLGVSSA